MIPKGNVWVNHIFIFILFFLIFAIVLITQSHIISQLRNERDRRISELETKVKYLQSRVNLNAQIIDYSVKETALK